MSKTEYDDYLKKKELGEYRILSTDEKIEKDTIIGQ